MNNTISFSTAVCAQYEILLKECRAALEAWEDRHEEASRSHSSGKEIGNQLLRLQADYARAYTMLRGHANDCEICQFLEKVSGRNSQYSLRANFLGKVPA